MATKKELEEKNKALKDKIAEMTKEAKESKATETSVENDENARFTALGIAVKEDGKLYLCTLAFNPDTGYAKVVEGECHNNSIEMAAHSMKNKVTQEIILPIMRGDV
jgi:hypothetical protein